jgi:hypothetical protein
MVTADPEPVSIADPQRGAGGSSEPHIEEAFSKIKGIVRKVGARTREALVAAIDQALATVIPEDAAGWFAHAGYEPQDQPL